MDSTMRREKDRFDCQSQRLKRDRRITHVGANLGTWKKAPKGRKKVVDVTMCGGISGTLGIFLDMKGAGKRLAPSEIGRRDAMSTFSTDGRGGDGKKRST